MPLPSALSNLRLPVVAAPMFLSSGPELVIACARAGVLGTFPALNPRTTAGFEEWLTVDRRGHGCTVWVNLIVHPTNARVQADLAVVVGTACRW